MRELRDSVLRAVALVVTDRRWAAPLSAMALGFGIFLGVAIGPAASGGLATAPPPLIAVAGPPPASEPEPAAEAAPPPPAEELAPEPEPFVAPEPGYASAAAEPPPPEPSPAPPPPEAEEEPVTEALQLKGAVVHANPAAQSYTLAIDHGELVSIHAAKLPPVGAELSAEAEPLGNSTFGELARERTGETERVGFEGVVSFRDEDPADPAYTVSGRGSSIRVHAADPEALPGLGAYVKVTARIETAGDGGSEEAEAAEATPQEAEDPAGEEEPTPCAADPELEIPEPPRRRLVETRMEAEPEPSSYLDLAGVLTAICPQTGQILLSADDLRSDGADLTLVAPKRFKLAKLAIGDSVLATAELGEDGTLTLAGLASDEGAEGAADDATAQGDLKR